MSFIAAVSKESLEFFAFKENSLVELRKFPGSFTSIEGFSWNSDGTLFAFIRTVSQFTVFQDSIVC